MPYPLGALSLDDAPHEIPSGDVYFIPKGTHVGILLGNAREITRELTSEEIEEEDRRTGDRFLQATYPTKKRGKITATLVQQSQVALNAADNADGEDDLEQPIANALVANYATALKNGVYECKGPDGTLYRNVTDVVVTDGAGTGIYDEGEYHLNARAGVVTLLVPPTGTGIKVTFSAAATTFKARRLHSSRLGQDGSIRILQDNSPGFSFDYVHPNVRIKMTEARKIVSENQEVNTFALDITLFPDPTAKPGWEFGYAVKLDAEEE